MNKKGEAMGINMIVVAVIALVVLVIIVYLIANQLGLFHKATSCGGLQDSVCSATCEELTEGTYVKYGEGKDVGCKEAELCCQKVG